MALIDSLPARPLEPQELTSLNRSEAFELVVAVENDGPARGLLFATEAWVKGAAYDDESGWSVVETEELDEETARIDGLQSCESAVLSFQDADSEE
ncbi:hypothetical protein E6P09_10755 [Haloferax mediterranei ATCC 33500]|uniref:DUF7964 domain-containing protein n=1 Tax=Haloferax mediterranei (strain ATCC 33500 / DSM 1411 / JCM 8866 / NBRC 14739 / NCIMB 2177 / R-4) TaxID=523841 RepID=I3R4U1_HALMT|nr:hypothetical protein [Haloferax mediterranei]RLM77758.1 hypothetical protein D3D02_19575 [Halobellus sp. Atlit-38R]AFK19251.1 hypothetical protein HFX_1544 [Haloferax mediterranei ATCC 33500]AHZ21390.1 hypothetical protein BM92_01405 [Haloferax mediterranei ATCC 33500]EMA04561.1 hypothetical protein C439_02762 [Haloferax mediterranei ATCC 33500]MDX5989353.1 hypothetical protein [Haloferax mediterranei ATCC 33500]